MGKMHLQGIFAMGFFIRERIVLANIAKIKRSRTKDDYSRSGKLFAEAKGRVSQISFTMEGRELL